MEKSEQFLIKIEEHKDSTYTMEEEDVYSVFGTGYVSKMVFKSSERVRLEGSFNWKDAVTFDTLESVCSVRDVLRKDSRFDNCKINIVRIEFVLTVVKENY